MAIGTLFTLFVLPAIYMLMAADHSRQASTTARDDAPVAADGTIDSDAIRTPLEMR